MIMLALPLVGLYVLTLGVIWLTHRRRDRQPAPDTETA
jgi:sec-independent protein translocase protein TatC